MIGGAALLLPIIVNNAMHAYDTTNAEHKNSSNDYTDDEIIYMRERMAKPWDGSCLVIPSEKFICRVAPFIGENKYALKEEGK